MNKEEESYLKGIFNESGKIINLEGTSTYVLDKGSGENIIFLNGILVWSYTWRKLSALMSKKYHIYTLDFKGTGFSEKTKGEYSIDFFTQQVRELMNYFNIKSAVIVGNSLGGEVAINFTAEYENRVKALVLIDTAGYQANKEITKLLVKLSKLKGTEQLLKLLNTKTFAKKLIQGAFYDESIINEDMVEAYLRPLKREGALEAFIELVKNLDSTEFEYAKVKSIKKPTLIIWGENDKCIPLKDAYKFHEDIKNSKLIILDKCGHAPQEEQPEVVAEAINRFVEEVKFHKL